MKEAKEVPELVGQLFCLDPPDRVLVVRAVMVADCSLVFVANKGVAVVEYGVLSNGTCAFRLRTMYLDSGNSFSVTLPFAVSTGEGLGGFLRSSCQATLREWWGLGAQDESVISEANMKELVDLVLINRPTA